VTILCQACKEESDHNDKNSFHVEQSIPQVVNYTYTTYRLKTFEIPENRGEEESYLLQKYELYLYPSTSTDSVELGIDVGGKMIEESYATKLGMPAGAAFYVRSYYAGGGNHYYGLHKGKELLIYKGYQKEPHPDSPDPVLEFDLMDTIKIFPNNIELIR
jgi:hypothetical protein